MEKSLDRLFDLLPVVYRQQDAEQHYPLRALLQVISEQVNLVEANIAQLYENWFIETCEDWVVPYLGDLVGYRLVHEAGEPGDVNTPQGQEHNKILIPRREIANTIRYRRRKGTVALLELLANDVAGWPARAVEFYRLLGWTQALNHLRPRRGQTVDLRRGNLLELLNSPFDELAHTVDVRRPNSQLMPGRTNIPNVGLFVWRLKAYSITEGEACLLEPPLEEREGSGSFTFSLLGNECQLFAHAQPETDPTQIATEMNLPAPIRRRAFERHPEQFYGEGKSIQIWKVFEREDRTTVEYVPLERIIPANLEEWWYYPSGEDVAVDPELGYIAFNPDPEFCPDYVRVSYFYGFSADIGGGEYNRPLRPARTSAQASQVAFYRVGSEEALHTITEALQLWTTVKAKQPHAIIEINDSREYSEQLTLALDRGQSLQIRAANRKRPVLYLADRSKRRSDFLKIRRGTGGRLTLDGLFIVGRGIRIEGNLEEVNIRHCTLVPGWEVFPHAQKLKRAPSGPSVELYTSAGCLNIERSILGSIQVFQDKNQPDPIRLNISDSILDATDIEQEALGGLGKGVLAPAILTIKHSTVIGQVQVHAIELAENTIFNGRVMVGRRQVGCLRFCYVPDNCRTPRRYHCQPELARQIIKEKLTQRANEIKTSALTEVEKNEQLQLLPEIEQAQQLEGERVRPQFNSTQYGSPAYCQLANSCAEEIKRGADDESEMGVFHHLFQPQRAANLRTRLSEYTPAEMDIGIIYVS